MGVRKGELVIDDTTDPDILLDPVVDGERKGRGHDPSQVIPEMFAPPSELPLIPRSEWSERIKEQERNKSRISDILIAANIPSMDQGPNGYCWGHSVTGCVQAVRAINNQPYVPLSAYMVCAIIKGGKNEGGWCGLAAKFIREVGVCSQQLWPQGDRNTRRDTAEVRANAALHKVTEDWVDLTKIVYDQNLTFEQMATCLLSGIPCAIDLNWWSHSILACDLVETSAIAHRTEMGKRSMVYAAKIFDELMVLCGFGDSLFGERIRNSWGDSWGDRGFGVLQGSRAVPDGAIAVRVSGGSPL